MSQNTLPVLAMSDSMLAVPNRVLWDNLSLQIEPGEFVTLLGANGSGKTSLLRVILGQLPLTQGQISIGGEPVRVGDKRIGYIPQQKLIPEGTPLRAKDLVALGFDGHRLGLPFRTRAVREQVDALIEAVGASGYKDAPVGTLSGGEQQRLRVAQALAHKPQLLLCDEPFLSLDLNHQRAVSELIDQYRSNSGCAVIFVTHDINPVLEMTTRILYLAQGTFRFGTPDEVLRSEVLSNLYKTPVEVIRANNRVIVVGIPDAQTHYHSHIGAS